MKSRILLPAFALAVSCFCAASNGVSVEAPDLRDLGALLGPGVQCLLAPSNAYKPGTIFRVNPAHVSYFVNQSLAEKIPTHTQAARLGTLSGQSGVSGGILGWLLGVRGPFSAKATAGTTHTISAQFELSKWEVTDDSEIDSITDWFADYRHKLADNEYFIVREAWEASSMRLRVSEGELYELRAELSLRKLLELSPWLRSDPSAEYNLSGVFPEPLRVCIKPERLVGERVRGKHMIYHSEPITRPLVITQQGEDGD